VKLDFFLLADAADASPDGKLYVHGGAITRLDAPGLPAAVRVTVVARLLIEDDDEPESTHTGSIEWIQPDGTRLGKADAKIVVAATHAAGLRRGEEQGILIVAPVAFVVEAFGPYEVRLALDGERLATRRLLAIRVEAAESDGG
jgi:hypothetical protein